jgi:hypothetical protein
LKDGIRKEIEKKSRILHYMPLYCINREQSLGGETVKFEHVMEVVASVLKCSIS